MLKKFEAMIISKVLSEAEREALIEKYVKFITDNGGEVTTKDYWGVKRLAYETCGYNDGDYHLLRFKLSNNALCQLDRKLKIDFDVLRHLLIRINK